MFWEEYAPYVLVGFGIGIFLVLLLIIEAVIVRANRRFLKDSAKEMAELLKMAGRVEEGKSVEKEMDRVLDKQLEDAVQRWKRRKRISARRD
jgi:hypothetical protein